MKRIFQIALILSIFLLTLTGCSYMSTERKVDILNRSGKAVIANSYYLIYPKDGVEEHYLTKKLVVNEDSSKEVVKTFKDRFYKTFGNLSVSEKNVDLEEGFKQAKLNGSNYLINIEINEWKDSIALVCMGSDNIYGQNNNSSKDTADITIYLYEVTSKTLINKQRLIAKGCPVILFNMIPIGTNSPEGYLEDLLDDWIKTL